MAITYDVYGIIRFNNQKNKGRLLNLKNRKIRLQIMKLLELYQNQENNKLLDFSR